MIINIIANIFIGTILAVIGIYLLIYRKVAFYSKAGNKRHFNEGVSLIIAVRNELDNLKQNLPFLLAQDYPNYEIIIVDDHSSDDSCLFIKEFAASFD